MLRARENSHPEVAEELLKRVYTQLEDLADMERPPRLEGRFFSMTLDPAKKALARKVAEEKQQKQAAKAAQAASQEAPAEAAEAEAAETVAAE